MLDGVVLAEDRGQAHDHAGQGRLGIEENVILLRRLLDRQKKEPT